MNLLSPIAVQWFILGLSLNVSYNDLENFQKSNMPNRVKLSETLKLWMTTTEPHLLTWKTVISVIEGPLINNRRLAIEICHYLTKGKSLAYKSVYNKFACTLAIQ